MNSLGGTSPREGMLPAQQGLEAGDPVFAEIEERLEHQKQLLARDGACEVRLQCLAVARGLVVFFLEEADRARSGLFGAIERGVGVLHDVERRVAVAGRQHDTDAGGADELAAFDQERFGEGRDETLGDFERIFRSCQIGHHQRELVAADTRDMLSRAGAALQAACDLDQDFVAGGMAEPVIDLLEAIEVEQQHGELLAGQREALERAIERLVEGDAVGQLRQRILPHRAFRLDLPHHAAREGDRIDEHAAQQNAAIDYDKESDQQEGEVAVSAETDGDTDEDGGGERDGGDRDGGKGERAAGQHARAQTGDDKLSAGRSVREEGDGDDAPSGAEHEGVAHQPVHRPARDELRLCDPARGMGLQAEGDRGAGDSDRPDQGGYPVRCRPQRNGKHGGVAGIGEHDADGIAEHQRHLFGADMAGDGFVGCGTAKG
ncbi:hypothetical protein ACVWYH_006570 [Bradyrhizobium sp. GM24.11]